MLASRPDSPMKPTARARPLTAIREPPFAPQLVVKVASWPRSLQPSRRRADGPERRARAASRVLFVRRIFGIGVVDHAGSRYPLFIPGRRWGQWRWADAAL